MISNSVSQDFHCIMKFDSKTTENINSMKVEMVPTFDHID